MSKKKGGKKGKKKAAKKEEYLPPIYNFAQFEVSNF